MPPSPADRSTMLGTTLFWIAVVLFLVAGDVAQTPPGGPYTDLIRKAFVALAAIVVSVCSAIVVLSWIIVIRRDRRA